MATHKQTLETNASSPWSVSTPHPGFGVDPNIKNELGHTHYPKWVDHPTEKEVVQISQSVGKDAFLTHKVVNNHPKRVLVQNEAEEKALLAGHEIKKSKGWDKATS